MRLTLVAAALLIPPLAEGGDPLTGWAAVPTDWKGANVTGERAQLTADRWSYLLRPGPTADAEVTANVTIREPGKGTRFFGETWSVWPDKTFGDQGWDAGLLLRAGEASGYRVQVSHRLQEV